MRSIKCSVIIANFNGKDYLNRCLNSVLREKGDYEIIVVDDDSPDKSGHLAYEQFKNNPRVKFILSKKNRGVAYSRNTGAKITRGKYLFFLDNDTEIKPNWLSKIDGFFRKYPQTGLVQTKLLRKGTRSFDCAGDYMGPFGFLIERARSAKDIGQFDKPDKIFSLKTAAAIVRANVFSKLRGFDENYHIYWEDTDFAWRCWLLGYEVRFLSEITVYHVQKDPSQYFYHQVFYRGCRNTLFTLIKNYGAKRLFLVVPVNFVCWFVLSLLFFLKKDFPKGTALLKGLLWNIIYLPQTLSKRKAIQQSRQISDEALFSRVGSSKPKSYYFGKAKAYVQGKPY